MQLGKIALYEPPSGMRRHAIEINAGVIDGRLRIRWVFSSNLHDRSTLEEISGSTCSALEVLAT
jgi:hypothetical protein